jgi:hypothetical protein
MVYDVYDLVHAGRAGKFVFDNGPVGRATIDEISFDGVPHQLFNLREGTQIRLEAMKDYRWLRVDGYSMNQSHPVPLNHNDYVLVCTNLEPKLGNIVVAALRNPPTHAEGAGVIKRLKENALYSESNQNYDPIPLEKVFIRGVVIAVAKPYPQDDGEVSPPSEILTEPTLESTAEKELYQQLCIMVQGDKGVAIRLIEFERKNTTKASIRELIQRAIDRLKRERTRYHYWADD